MIFRVRMKTSCFKVAAFLIGAVACNCSLQAALVTITGGTMSLTYDGAVFADVNSSSSPATPGQDYMRFGKYWTPSQTVNAGPAYAVKQPAAFRPLPFTTPSGNPRQPNFRDNRAALDPQFPLVSPTNILGVNGNGPVANSEGRNRISTNLTFDTSNVPGTVSGLVQTNGVSAWWFSNDDHIDLGVAWISWGDLSLRYDSSRTGLGYSGWVFANQLGGVGDIFDTKNITMNASQSGITLSGEIWSSDGASADPYNENFATWETYTFMKPNLRIGSFSFSGSAVPEPSSLALLGIGLVGAVLLKRRSDER